MQWNRCPLGETSLPQRLRPPNQQNLGMGSKGSEWVLDVVGAKGAPHTHWGSGEGDIPTLM